MKNEEKTEPQTDGGQSTKPSASGWALEIPGSKVSEIKRGN